MRTIAAYLDVPDDASDDEVKEVTRKISIAIRLIEFRSRTIDTYIGREETDIVDLIVREE